MLNYEFYDILLFYWIMSDLNISGADNISLLLEL